MNYEVLCDTSLNYIQFSSIHQPPSVTKVKMNGYTVNASNTIDYHFLGNDLAKKKYFLINLFSFSSKHILSSPFLSVLSK